MVRCRGQDGQNMERNLKVLVISQPKSGTYLCANLLKEFDLNFTGLHLSQRKYEQYPQDNLQDVRNNLSDYRHRTDLNESIKMINNNSFAVGHIGYSDSNAELLSDFKKILITRPANERIESGMRWAVMHQGKSTHWTKEKLEQRYNDGDHEGWLNENNVFHITFNDMKNKNISRINQLQEFLFGSKMYDSNISIDNALNKDSLTKAV